MDLFESTLTSIIASGPSLCAMSVVAVFLIRQKAAYYKLFVSGMFVMMALSISAGPLTEYLLNIGVLGKGGRFHYAIAILDLLWSIGFVLCGISFYKRGINA